MSPDVWHAITLPLFIFVPATPFYIAMYRHIVRTYPKIED